jgi:hypothetical protein
VDDRRESPLGSSAEDHLRTVNVRLLDLLAPTRVEGENGGGVDDRLTAVERGLHRLRIRDVADARIDLAHPEWLESRSDPLGRPHQQTDFVARRDERRGCVRADEPGSTREENSHGALAIALSTAGCSELPAQLRIIR